MSLSLQFILIGLFTGAITGVTGASGVLIVVPILTTLFDMPLQVVLGTSLLVDVIATILISYTYARNKNVDIKKVFGFWLAPCLVLKLGLFL